MNRIPGQFEQEGFIKEQKSKLVIDRFHDECQKFLENAVVS
jgi:hypothetical protein